MASFTAYIFREDHFRLTQEADIRGDGGSLYGQWTSTGNPVVHVAFSKTLPNHSGTRRFLSDSFKLCHIGEWRPVPTEQKYGRVDRDPRQREALLSKYNGQGMPARFLILDVNLAKIVPYLFDRRIPQGQGHLEILSGQNPFNIALKNPRLTANPMPSQAERHPGAGLARSNSQGADVQDHQWYSPENGGKEKIQFLLQKFQGVAVQGSQVDISRDKTSHDMSMTFTDWRLRKWEVKFPWKFPEDGATLINKGPSTTGYGRQYPTRHVAAEQSVAGDRDLNKVARDIIYYINK